LDFRNRSLRGKQEKIDPTGMSNDAQRVTMRAGSVVIFDSRNLDVQSWLNEVLEELFAEV